MTSTDDAFGAAAAQYIDRIADELDLRGIRSVLGSVVDMSGVARGKSVPLGRLRQFASAGMGAALSWSVFCADDALAFTHRFTVVGDLRLRLDIDGLRDIGTGTAWAPADVVNQDGTASEYCTRTLLRRAVADLDRAGLDSRVGCELEFTLAPDTAGRPGRWTAYGVSAALAAGEFFHDVLEAADVAGLSIEQFHAEYGPGQYELSLSPADPLTAADAVVLARILVSRAARRHGLPVSFSPMPQEGAAGNGAHQHLSLAKSGRPLFSGGSGPHGLQAEGAGAIAGLLSALPGLMGVLAGSPVSHLRLKPNQWSGVFRCWGLENREAAVRLCAATRGNPHGANIELKCVDASANPYLSTAVILHAALDGIEERRTLPAEATGNPADLTEAERGTRGMDLLPTGQQEVLEHLKTSPSARRMLGDGIFEALAAVRAHEQSAFDGVPVAAAVERLRYAWSL
jgi:glutamine synthetase